MAEPDWKATLVAKLPEILHVVLSVLGVIIMTLAITKGIACQNLLPVTDEYSRMLLGVLGAIVLFLGLYLRRPGLDASIPKKEDYGIVITKPSEGDTLQTTEVRGLIKKALPDSYKLWVFRVYDGGGFYPLRECIMTQTGDEWFAPGWVINYLTHTNLRRKMDSWPKNSPADCLKRLSFSLIPRYA